MNPNCKAVDFFISCWLLFGDITISETLSVVIIAVCIFKVKKIIARLPTFHGTFLSRTGVRFTKNDKNAWYYESLFLSLHINVENKRFIVVCINSTLIVNPKNRRNEKIIYTSHQKCKTVDLHSYPYYNISNYPWCYNRGFQRH